MSAPNTKRKEILLKTSNASSRSLPNQKTQRSLREKVLTKNLAKTSTSSADSAQSLKVSNVPNTKVLAKVQAWKQAASPLPPPSMDDEALASSPLSDKVAPAAAVLPSSTPSDRYLAAVARLKALPAMPPFEPHRDQAREARVSDADAAVESTGQLFESDANDGNYSDTAESVCSHDSSTRTIAGSRMVLNEFPKHASQVLQRAKESLEKSGNLKREIRESVVASLHELYEMILKLSDSRALHIMESYRIKAELATQKNQSNKRYIRAMENLLKEHSGVKSELTSMGKTLEEQIAATRTVLVRDVCEPLIEVKKNSEKTTKVGETIQDMRTVLREMGTTLKTNSTETTDRKQEQLILELRSIHQDLAKLETMHHSVLEVDTIKETVHEAMQATSISCARNLTSELMQPIAVVTAENAERLQRLENEAKSLRQDLQEQFQPLTERLEAVSSELRTMRGTRQQLVIPTDVTSLGAEMAAADNPKSVMKPKPLYADALKKPPLPKPNHTLIVSSTDPRNTGDNVIERIRIALDIKKTGAKVDKVRKARNQKVILSCSTKEDLSLIQSRVKQDVNLKAEIAKNKNPLVIIRDVLSFHTDAELVEHLLAQNKHLLQGIEAKECSLKVRYRKKARNPLECHPVFEVSPQIHKRYTEAGKVYIGLQRRPVEDHSPLVQCTKCLGFGHTKAICKEKDDLCSHCGEAHLWEKCAIRIEGKPPNCKNCQEAHGESRAHNAFNGLCPERQRWDAIARSRVAYC